MMNLKLPTADEPVTKEKAIEVLEEMALQSRFQAQEQQVLCDHYYPIYTAALFGSHDKSLSRKSQIKLYDDALRMYDNSILTGRRADGLTAEARVLEAAVAMLKSSVQIDEKSNTPTKADLVIAASIKHAEGQEGGRVRALRFLREKYTLSLKEGLDIINGL